MWGPMPRMGPPRPYLPPMRPPIRMRPVSGGMRPPMPRHIPPGHRPRFPPLLHQGPVRPPPPMFGARPGLRPPPPGLRPPGMRPPPPGLRSPIGVRPPLPPGFMPGFGPGFRPHLGPGPRPMRPMAGRGRGAHKGNNANAVKEKVVGKKQSVEEHFCENCDRGFKTAETLSEHTAQHRTCGRDGCQFTAHPGVVAKHIKMQHDSGLFKKIKDLYTPEDISKWRAERKRCYPSKENVERRQAIQEEKNKRGETLVTENQSFGPNQLNQRGRPFDARGRGHRGRGGNRGRGRPEQSRSNVEYLSQKRGRAARKKFVPAAPIDDEDMSEWCGNLRPFRGTGVHDEEATMLKAEQPDPEEFSDTEWTETSAEVCQKVPVMSQALSTLVGLYGSDSEDSGSEEAPQPVCSEERSKELANTAMIVDETSNGHNRLQGTSVPRNTGDTEVDIQPLNDTSSESCTVEKTTSLLPLSGDQVCLDVSSKAMLEDDDLPSEVPILSKDQHSPVCEEIISANCENITTSDPGAQPDGTVLDSNSGLKSEEGHNKRKRSRRNHYNKNEQPTGEHVRIQRTLPFRNKPFPFRRRHPTLLEKLLRNEIRHERNILLQCVRYTVENNFFQHPTVCKDNL